MICPITLRLISGLEASLHSTIAMSPLELKAKTSVEPDPGRPNSLTANTRGATPSRISSIVRREGDSTRSFCNSDSAFALIVSANFHFSNHYHGSESSCYSTHN
ncbi:hypothetical protein KEJ18_02840 [Candidatus Bathyarchaeota archaeon]|nr:hypothetical protein [Candidatus Bathyarchaeota archaeon]